MFKEADKSIRWERFGNEWINKRFVSSNYNIFITEIIKNGVCLYWFDDGPEIPTESVDLDNTKFIEMERNISELINRGEQAVCNYLASFFPELQKYWVDNYGSI
jgi:hypothetical protein